MSHMKLILVHRPPSNPSSDVGVYLAQELSHIYNCPKVNYCTYHGTFTNVIGYLSGLPIDDYSPKKLFPYGDCSNAEATESVTQFFTNWLGPDIEAKIFVEHCHQAWRQTEEGHRPMFITDATLLPGHWEILTNAFKIIEVYCDEDHLNSSASVHKHLVREGNRRDFLQFARETAPWMVQNG